MADKREQKPTSQSHHRDGAGPQDRPSSRRGFLLRSALASLALAAAGSLWALGKFSLFTGRQKKLIHVGKCGDFVPGTWRLLSDTPIYLLATDRGLAAMSARCTHLGCTVRRRGEGFACPCHGSTFNMRGEALTPPATEPLHWLQVSVIAGAVYVDPDQQVEAETFVQVGGCAV